jgi:hypothetical protein
MIFVNKERNILMTTIDVTKYHHHPCIEEITTILSHKTGNESLDFFRIVLIHFLGKICSSMRTTIDSKVFGDEIPINIYAIALAPSGYGKGTSVGFIEEKLLTGFKHRFLNDTFKIISDQNLWQLAAIKSASYGTEEQEEKTKLDKEFARLGPPNFTFDSGSPAATKQLRDKFLLADCGSINLQIDEIGSNLVGNGELLHCFLELYDKGKIKQKITKQSNDNKRSEDLDGCTPANMLLFGTPSKLLDGGKTEQEFYELLETGYARRCIFGHGIRSVKEDDPTDAIAIFNKLSSPHNKQIIDKWSNHFIKLADPVKHNMALEMEDDVSILLIQYKLNCEKAASLLPESDEIKKSEIAHRYFRVLKIAGIYAFIDESLFIEISHIESAIKLVEESGKAFQKILTREKNYVKLANYIAESKQNLTHADLHEALAFYKTSSTQRNELMNLAMAWGYKNCVIIKKEYIDSIEFFSADKLKETNIDELLLSMSTDLAYNYKANLIPFDHLIGLTETNDIHYCNHQFDKEHRSDSNTINGFNTVVLDVDNDNPNEPIISIELVKVLLKEYTFFLHTTKRHTDEQPRFRIILPIKYILRFGSDEYRQFMNNIFEWIPFKVDHSYNSRCKKSMSNETDIYHLNEGMLLNPLPFIPKTSKNEEFLSNNIKLSSLNAIEKFFALEMQEGNRNNTFLKYALCLKDAGYNYVDIENKILNLNKQIPNPLTELELKNTVLLTVARKVK